MGIQHHLEGHRLFAPDLHPNCDRCGRCPMVVSTLFADNSSICKSILHSRCFSSWPFKYALTRYTPSQLNLPAIDINSCPFVLQTLFLRSPVRWHKLLPKSQLHQTEGDREESLEESWMLCCFCQTTRQAMVTVTQVKPNQMHLIEATGNVTKFHVEVQKQTIASFIKSSLKTEQIFLSFPQSLCGFSS